MNASGSSSATSSRQLVAPRAAQCASTPSSPAMNAAYEGVISCTFGSVGKFHQQAYSSGQRRNEYQG